MPAELASRVGTFLTLTRTGEMQLDDDYYSETPLRITMVEEQPQTGDETADEMGDETGEKDISIDEDSSTDDDSDEPALTGGRMIFRIEETPVGTGSRTIGGKSSEVDPQHRGTWRQSVKPGPAGSAGGTAP